MRALDETLLMSEAREKLAPYLGITGPSTFIGKERVIPVICHICGTASMKYALNIRKGMGLGCKCQRNRKYSDPRAQVLGERYDAMIQRCRPGTFTARNYGDRGIRVEFESREHFIRWMLEHLPHPTYRGVDIDRIDNEGNYRPGNLRLTTRSKNLTNKRQSITVEYMGMQVAPPHVWHLLKTDYPELDYYPTKVTNLVRSGVRPEEIPHRPRKRGGRPSSTTLPKPDPAIVSLYREG